MVIHETLACQEARSKSITGRQTNVDHKQDFPIVYDVLYDKEEQTDPQYLPRCKVVNSQLIKGKGSKSITTREGYVSGSVDEDNIFHRVLSSARIASFNSSSGANSFLSTRSNCTFGEPCVFCVSNGVTHLVDKEEKVAIARIKVGLHTSTKGRKNDHGNSNETHLRCRARRSGQSGCCICAHTRGTIVARWCVRCL